MISFQSSETKRLLTKSKGWSILDRIRNEHVKADLNVHSVEDRLEEFRIRSKQNGNGAKVTRLPEPNKIVQVQMKGKCRKTLEDGSSQLTKQIKNTVNKVKKGYNKNYYKP